MLEISNNTEMKNTIMGSLVDWTQMRKESEPEGISVETPKDENQREKRQKTKTINNCGKTAKEVIM